MLELFRSDVRFTPTQSFTQMSLLLPAHSENITNTEIGNLDVTFRINQKVLRLDIPMSDSHRVQVRDTGDDLLEVGIDLHRFEVTLLDRCVKVSSRAVLHNFAPMLLFVLNEIDSFDNVVTEDDDDTAR